MKEESVKISCIIPTLNEEAHVGRLVSWLTQCLLSDLVEIIVVDGKSDDNTEKLAKEAGAIVLTSEIRSRAHQMNLGARVAKGEILYFVHADTMPPSCCFEDVIKALKEGHLVGGFRFKFDSDKKILKFNSFMTRFNVSSFRGGDQSIFIEKKIFEKMNGYDEKYVIMEEYDLLRRVKALGIKYYLIQKDVLVSARKYDGRTWLEVNWANVKAMAQFRRGVPPKEIKNSYLRHKKVPNSEF
jgi:rSAM/selenodomain-associated transferase 2